MNILKRVLSVLFLSQIPPCAIIILAFECGGLDSYKELIIAYLVGLLISAAFAFILIMGIVIKLVFEE